MRHTHQYTKATHARLSTMKHINCCIILTSIRQHLMYLIVLERDTHLCTCVAFLYGVCVRLLQKVSGVTSSAWKCAYVLEACFVHFIFWASILPHENMHTLGKITPGIFCVCIEMCFRVRMNVICVRCITFDNPKQRTKVWMRTSTHVCGRAA